MFSNQVTSKRKAHSRKLKAPKCKRNSSKCYIIKGSGIYDLTRNILSVPFSPYHLVHIRIRQNHFFL